MDVGPLVGEGEGGSVAAVLWGGRGKRFDSRPTRKKKKASESLWWEKEGHSVTREDRNCGLWLRQRGGRKGYFFE